MKTSPASGVASLPVVRRGKQADEHGTQTAPSACRGNSGGKYQDARRNNLKRAGGHAAGKFVG